MSTSASDLFDDPGAPPLSESDYPRYLRRGDRIAKIGLLQAHDLLDTPSRGDYAFLTPPTRAMLDELWQQVPEDRA